MEQQQQPEAVNEYEVALDVLTQKLGKAERENAVLVAQLTGAHQREQQLRAQLAELTIDDQVDAGNATPAAGLEVDGAAGTAPASDS